MALPIPAGNNLRRYPAGNRVFPEKIHIHQTFRNIGKLLRHRCRQNQFRQLFRANNSQSMGNGLDLTLQPVKGTVDNFQQTRSESGIIPNNSGKLPERTPRVFKCFLQLNMYMWRRNYPVFDRLLDVYCHINLPSILHAKTLNLCPPNLRIVNVFLIRLQEIFHRGKLFPSLL